MGTATIEMVIAYLLGERRVRNPDGTIPTSAKAAKMLRWARALTGIGAAQIAAEIVFTYIDNNYCEAYENRPLWWWPSDWNGDD